MIKRTLLTIALMSTVACDRTPALPVVPDEIQDCACEYYKQRGDAKLAEVYCALRGVR